MKYSAYQPCAACVIWFGDRLMLTERKTKVFNGCFGGVGGKIDPGETIIRGLAREILEETGYLIMRQPRLLDCYVDEENQHKVFLFDHREHAHNFNFIYNCEPEKHGPWTLYTREKALELNLIPFLRTYLEKNLTPPDMTGTFSA